MFHNEMNDLDDSETLESINYEAEQKKFDEKMSQSFDSFYLRFVKEDADTEQGEDGTGTGNMLETLRMKIRLLREDSKLAKMRQVEVSKGAEEHAKMKQEAEKLGRETSDQAKAAEEMAKTAEQKEERLRAGRSERANQSSVVENQRKKVTAELAEYQQTLGLEIIRSTRGGNLLIFTNISRDNPERKFSLELISGESAMFFKFFW